MSFIYWSYLPIIICFLLILFFILKKYESKYFQWIEDHWFLKRSTSSKIASLLKFIGLGLLIVSLMDLRGREEKINSSIPDQRTIILIDKSLSMLVEDVRPNRFKKAVMMARHFVKRAAGHQISIIVFSDTHKRVVPFTDDIDLLDSILGGLNDLNLAKGGSELSLAIKESINYFTLNSEYKGGNLLVFTDGEEHDSLSGMTIPTEVNLAMVGVGTLKGGPIPIRRRDGSFSGYKKHNRTQVVSALNEKNIKDFVDKTKNSKYWVSLSYSLPTEEILNFFRGRFKSKMASGEVRIRPVLAKKIIIPAIVFFILSYLVSLRRTYVSLLIVLSFFSFNEKTFAQEEKPKTALEIQTEELMERFKRGNLSESQKLKLAENFIRLGDSKKAELLFEETVKNYKGFDNSTLLNMSTTYLQNKKFSKAVNLIDELESRTDLTEEQKKVLENNTLKALRTKKKKGKGESKDDKEKKDQDEKNQDQQNNDQQNKDNKKNQSSGQDQKKDQKQSKKGDSKDNDDKKKKDKKKGKEKKQEKKDQKDKKKGQDKKEQKKSVRDKENEIKKKRKMVKVPATLKQLMNDDRGLRKKHLKTTLGKGERSKKKDW